MENNIELQEMREQLASFKRQLAGQKIINEKLMRRATAEKASKLTKLRNNYLLICAFALFVVVPTFHFRGFPPYLTLYMLFITILDCAMTYSYHMKVDKADFMNGDLRYVVTELKTLRKKYQQWYWIALPEVAILLVLLYYSLMHVFANPEFVRTLMMYSGVGILIGGTIGFCMNNRAVSLCDEIIKELEEN